MIESMPRLTTSVRSVAGQPWLVLGGALDLGTAEAMRDLLRMAQQRTAHLTLDLSGVRSVDAAGLGVLVAALRRAETAGGSLVVGRASEEVLGAIELIGLRRVLAVGAPT